MNYIYVDRKTQYDLIGIVEDGDLVEFYIEDKKDKFKIGNIFRGRVENISKSLESGFIDIGHEKKGFLNKKDIVFKNKEEKEIEDLLKNGENKIVQIIKEPYEKKGAKLTTDITIPGNFMVLTPFSKKINISNKIDKKNIHRLREIGENIIKNNIGFVLRTNSKNETEENILKEYNNLIELYEKLEKEKNFLPTPKLIYEDMKLLYKLVNQEKYKEYKILINNKVLYKQLQELDDNLFKNINNRLLLDNEFDLIYNSKLYQDILKAIDRKIELKNGGYIFIDKTEAMTVIDVNSGSFNKGQDLNETIYKINLEASIEIAKQIRLRNITGIIIIDFIDFRKKEHENKFLEEFNKILLKDSNKANIISMTKLGLVEMTREKNRESDLEYFTKHIINNN